MIPKLTDFSSAELDTMLTALAHLKSDLTNKIELCEKYNIPRPAHTEEMERVNLLITQVLGAKIMVRMKDTVQNN